jgi:phospholipase/carboxylesterase
MTDRWDSDYRPEDFAPRPTAANRILRFESKSALAVAEAAPRVAPVTQFDHLDVPHRIYVPEGYEPAYAYPLIVWFHDDGADEHDVDDVLPRISERNYLGVALRGNVFRSVRFGWSTADDRLSEILCDLHDVVDAVSEHFAIHPQRKYLAGFGAGGTLAWEVLLREPSAWTGAMCLSATFPKISHPLSMFRELQERRLLLSAGLDGPSTFVAELVNAGRLMYSAGMQVGTRIYDAGAAAPTDKMLRDVDRWVMDSIATAVQ